MAEAQSSRSLDWPPSSLFDQDKPRPQAIPGTRLRSNPAPVRFLDRLAETRTAFPAHFVTQPLARQIAGYAVGGCWTHIGCAQSVVAYAFIQRDVDEHYTPAQWIKEMTPVIVKVMVLLTILIYVESSLINWLR